MTHNNDEIFNDINGGNSNNYNYPYPYPYPYPSLDDNIINYVSNARTSLDLSNSNIENLPRELAALLPTIQRLDLSNNELSSIDNVLEFLQRLPQLRSVNLSGNNNIQNDLRGLYERLNNQRSPIDIISVSNSVNFIDEYSNLVDFMDWDGVVRSENEIFDLMMEEICAISDLPEDEKSGLMKFVKDENAKELQNFRQFLIKCSLTKDWKPNESKKRLSKGLIDIMQKMQNNESLVKNVESQAAFALGSCGDRVIYYYIQMQLECNYPHKNFNEMSDKELYEYARREAILDYLTKKAEAKCVQRGSEADQVETHLAYIRLASEFGIDIDKVNMTFEGLSGVKEEDKKEVRDFLSDNDNVENIICNYMLDHDDVFAKMPIIVQARQQAEAEFEFPDHEGGQDLEKYKKEMKELFNKIRNKQISFMKEVFKEKAAEKQDGQDYVDDDEQLDHSPSLKLNNSFAKIMSGVRKKIQPGAGEARKTTFAEIIKQRQETKEETKDSSNVQQILEQRKGDGNIGTSRGV